LKSRWIGLIACLVLSLGCALIALRTSFIADMSAFLPRTPTAEQQVLVDQLRDGVASRLLIIGLTHQADDVIALATLSKKLALHLRKDAAFLTVANGESVTTERDQTLLFENRYLLSPNITAQRFTVEALHAAFKESIAALGMSSGLFTKQLLLRDPTAETLFLTEQMIPQHQPRIKHGVWFGKTANRAVLVVQTRAAGSDLDSQQAAIEAVKAAFRELNADGKVSMQLSGPGLFAVNARANIQTEVTRLSTIASVVLISLLLLVYRSPRMVILGLLPVISGTLAGIAAVSLGFGSVHGMTLGFGITLIGEAVDYAIYLFVQHKPGSDLAAPEQRFWPTIRLGVLTSICGFASLLFSGFTGLAQLGLFSIAGLVVAASVARWVLPGLIPRNFQVNHLYKTGEQLQRGFKGLYKGRGLSAVMAVSAMLYLGFHHSDLWHHELKALSPVPLSAQELDTFLRADVAAPDVRYLVVVRALDQEAALQAAEQVSAVLESLVQEGSLAGFESVSRYLPSQLTQQQRQLSLPQANILQENIARASKDLPLQAEKLKGFVLDVQKAKTAPLVIPTDLEGSAIGAAVQSLLVKQQGAYTALFPLRAADQGNTAYVIQEQVIRQALNSLQSVKPLLIDLKTQSDALYKHYLQEAIVLSLIGVAAIVGLIWTVLKSFKRMVRVIAAPLASVVIVAAGLHLLGIKMSLLHLIGLQLIVAIGSNYSLFFDQASDKSALDRQMLVSLLLANITTVIGFGLLAFSSVPVLNAFGITVGPGAFLSLLLAASFNGKAASNSSLTFPKTAL